MGAEGPAHTRGDAPVQAAPVGARRDGTKLDQPPGTATASGRLTHLQRTAGNRAVSALVRRRQGTIGRPFQRDGEGEPDVPSVTGLSGYYEFEERLDGGDRKLTVLFLNVNQVSLVGNYRSFIDGGEGWDAHDAGDLRGERVPGADGIRYDAASEAGSWMLQFRVHRTEGLAALRRGGVTVPLVVSGLDGVPRDFRRRGDQGPVTDVNVRDAPEGTAGAVDRERRRGLTPVMVDALRESSRAILEELQRHPVSGGSGIDQIARRSVAEAVDRALSPYSGDLRRQARTHLMQLLRRHRVQFLEERVRADRAVTEAVSATRVDQGSEPDPDESAAVPFTYRLVFRGVRGGGRAVAGIQVASGALEVTALEASRTESSTAEVWTRNYHFEEIRIQASAGGGLSGGVYWKTFHATSAVEWTQDDFRQAEIYILGLQAPNVTASAQAGPASVSLANCQSYQFEGMVLRSGPKSLELQADEKTFECSSDLTATGPEGQGTAEGNDEGGVGIEGEAHLGQLESGVGSIQGLPGQDYSDDRQQLPDTTGGRGTTEVEASGAQAGHAYASAALDRVMLVQITQRLASYQNLLTDPTVPVRIVGHASSAWTGGGDPQQGNLELSRQRAQTVEGLIRSAFELPDDRILDVSWLGDQEARAAGGTTSDDDPAYRRVDVHVAGARTVPLTY